MPFEKIVVNGKRKGKISALTPLFSNLGFSKVKVQKKALVVEKSLGKNLEGKTELDYRIVFEEKKIIFEYSVFSESQKRSRKIESLSTFLNILSLVHTKYNLEIEPIIQPITELIHHLGKTVDKEGVDLTQKIDDLKTKNEQIMVKYQDLVRSSEENARLLLEAERRNGDLSKRVEKLEGMSDETLKEEIFKWIKLHDGHLDVNAFSQNHKIPTKRVEQGVNLLIREGYIKKR